MLISFNFVFLITIKREINQLNIDNDHSTSKVSPSGSSLLFFSFRKYF